MPAHENLHSGQFKASGLVSTPTPDGGANPHTAGMVIQNNWEALRDSGMSAEDATAQLHNLTPPTPTPGPWSGLPFPGSAQFNSDPNQATMSGPTIPATVRAPAVTPTWNPGPSLGSTIVQNLTHFSRPPTTPTNSYGQVGQILNRRVVDQA